MHQISELHTIYVGRSSYDDDQTIHDHDQPSHFRLWDPKTPENCNFPQYAYHSHFTDQPVHTSGMSKMKIQSRTLSEQCLKVVEPLPIPSCSPQDSLYHIR